MTHEEQYLKEGEELKERMENDPHAWQDIDVATLTDDLSVQQACADAKATTLGALHEAIALEAITDPRIVGAFEKWQKEHPDIELPEYTIPAEAGTKKDKTVEIDEATLKKLERQSKWAAKIKRLSKKADALKMAWDTKKEEAAAAKKNYDEQVAKLRSAISTGADQPMLPTMDDEDEHDEQPSAQEPSDETPAEDPSVEERTYWREIPITDLDLDSVPRLGRTGRARLIETVPTLGALEDLRAAAEADKKHLAKKLPKGLGEPTADRLIELHLQKITPYQTAEPEADPEPQTDQPPGETATAVLTRDINFGKATDEHGLTKGAEFEVVKHKMGGIEIRTKAGVILGLNEGEYEIKA